MKVSLILLALAASCAAQSPEGWRPSGRVLLLPARIEEEPTTPTPQANSTETNKKESARILDSGEYYVLLENGRLQMVKYTTAALKEQEGNSATQSKNQQPQQSQQFQTSQSPQYPVYQQQKQFQNSFYQNQQFQQSQKSQYPVYQQAQQYRNPTPASSSASSQQANSEPFAKFQLEYVQFPLPGSQYAQTKLAYTAPEPEADAEEKEDTEEPSGYEAKVQYRDVKPISAPIYAYNSEPLIRILKK